MSGDLKEYLGNLVIEQLMQTPVGERLSQAVQVFETVYKHYSALSEKQDELDMTGMKAITCIAFSILGKLASGISPSAFTSEDWKDIIRNVSEQVILQEDQAYSIYIFRLYEQYIRYSVSQIQEIILPTSAEAILQLADELRNKAEQLKFGQLSEVQYTEDCLWIALEAMIKLLACTASLTRNEQAAQFADAAASFAFEYGRMMLYRRELEIVNQFMEEQYQLDDALAQKYADYLTALNQQAEQFYVLLENAFAPDFRSAFLSSVLLAEKVGADGVLATEEDIDSFFLD